MSEPAKWPAPAAQYNVGRTVELWRPFSPTPSSKSIRGERSAGPQGSVCKPSDQNQMSSISEVLAIRQNPAIRDMESFRRSCE
jgi:hypothetical protein